MNAERQMIDTFCRKLNVVKVSERAAQFYTQLMSASAGRTHHPSLQHPQVKVCICIELASRQHRLPVEKSFLIKLAGIPQKQYKTAFSVSESLLKVKNNATMQQLGVQFSCSNHVSKATEIHSFYSNKINRRQKEMGHEPLDLEGPLYKCAAFVAAAKMCRSRTNAREFCTTLSLTVSQLDTISKDMLSFKDEMKEEKVSQTFAQKLEARSQQLNQNSTKKKSAADENLLWKFYPTGTLRSVYNQDFLNWKEKMIAQSSS